MLIHFKGRANTVRRTHRPFANWRARHDVPAVCFAEWAIMVLYLIFVFLYQGLTISFSLDFRKTADDFGFGERVTMISNRMGKVNSGAALLWIVDEMAARFIAFADSIPFGLPFYVAYVIAAGVTTMGGAHVGATFAVLNVSRTGELVRPLLRVARRIEMSTVYHMQHSTGESEFWLVMAVAAAFERDPQNLPLFLEVLTCGRIADRVKFFAVRALQFHVQQNICQEGGGCGQLVSARVSRGGRRSV